MINRDEAFEMVKRADDIMKKLTTEAAAGHDVLSAVYTFLKIAREAEEWHTKLMDIRDRDWREYLNSPEYEGNAQLRGDWWK